MNDVLALLNSINARLTELNTRIEQMAHMNEEFREEIQQHVDRLTDEILRGGIDSDL